MAAVSLLPFSAVHVELFRAWLDEPAVRTYWGEPAETYDLALDLPERYDHAFIAEDGEPVGYIRWARCGLELLASVGIHDLPDGAVDIDLFLCSEATRGRGTGPVVLEQLAQRLFAEGAPVLSLISSLKNERAHRAFEKAGWTKDRPYDDATFGDCWLFLRRPDAS